ncbi:cell division protein PerM [Rhodoglobus aureus]|uniref:Integral membrane protein n=1 Tax=Rhodoglobus aureus TaxID=191497 RepID=A0ABN1VGX5_9MICO
MAAESGGTLTFDMNRQLTLLFAAFEALLVVAIGIAIPLVPLTLLWGIHYGLAIDWTVFWRAAVDIWLVGHGVDMTVVLDPTVSKSLGFAAASTPVTITIALLGFSLLTVLLGVRAGRRVAETTHALLGTFASLVTFGLASLIVTLSAQHPVANPSLWQGALLPTVVFAVGLLIGSQVVSTKSRVVGPVRRWVLGWPSHVRTILATSLRGGAIAAAGLLTIASIATMLAIITSYAEIISLYEALHTEVLGGVAVTLGQLALLPNVVLWATSWLVGPGFAIGVGSTVSPLATSLGPIPAIPVLGALPIGDFAFGYVGLLAPVVVGFLVAAVLGPRIAGELRRRELAIVALGIGVAAAAIIGLLVWASAGSAGPGRLSHVGPQPWIVTAWAFVEFSVAAGLGLLTSARPERADDGFTQR